jgi:hypothetical protein
MPKTKAPKLDAAVPRCPKCEAELAGRLGVWVTPTVVGSVALLYCQKCRTTLGTVPAP